MQIPIMADVTKEIAARYGTLKASAGIALRGLFIITPEGVVEHVTMNNFPIGRNVDEAKRVLQAVQYVAEHGEVCPAGWKPGDKSMIADPEKSLDYFESIGEGAGYGGDDENGHDADEKNLVVVKSKKEYDTLVNGSDSGKVAVKYWAPWCGKCRQIAPHVNQLAADHPGVKVVSFDTTADALEAMASDLGVKGLPHFRFFKDGKEVLERLTGYKKKPLAENIVQLEKM
jgi:thiol-disulfide isomerase/thioredoxin